MLVYNISLISSFFLLSYAILIIPATLFFFVFDYSWILEWTIFSISRSSFTFNIILDSVSLRFRVLVCTISGFVIIFSKEYILHENFFSRFIKLVISFVLTINFLIFIPSLPALLLGWDGLGITSFLLVVYYQNYKSLAAGILTIIVNRIGDVLIILCIALLVTQGHWLVTLFWDFNLSFLVIILITVAAITKRAQIPFSAWLPAAIAAPTPVSALVHSSTLVTAGVYLLIRFHFFFSNFIFFNKLLLFFSTLTLLMAGIRANMETDLKKIIALSTLSQLGLIIFRLALNLPLLALFHLFIHALFKALLFLCAGIIIHFGLNNQDIRVIGIVSAQFPGVVACINIGNFALCGMPFISGFYSKDLILERSFVCRTNVLIIFLIFVATGLTAGYTVRIALATLWGPINSSPYYYHEPARIYLISPIVFLGCFAVVGGAVAQALFFDFNALIVLPYQAKIFTPFAILSGCALSLVLSRAWWNPSKKRITKLFSTEIWFLSHISMFPFSKLAIESGTLISKSVDHGWSEVLGAQGVFFTARYFSDIIAINQVKFFNFVLMSFIRLRLVFLLF